MQEASAALHFEKAARLRDDIEALKKLGLRGDVDQDVQPEVFPIEPKKGLVGLRKVLGLEKTPRTIEGVDIAHLGGEDTVASLVQLHRRPAVQAGLSALPHPVGAGRRRLRLDPRGGDAPLPPAVAARRRAFPDILLIDGGKGQLNAALEAFRLLDIEPPCLISLAKREEEIYRPGESEPLRLSRHSAALRLLQYVRDEAHRFAQHYHHILRARSWRSNAAVRRSCQTCARCS